jgi:hypothetical protein
LDAHLGKFIKVSDDEVSKLLAKTNPVSKPVPKKTASTNKQVQNNDILTSPNIDSEKVIVGLYHIKDELIDNFQFFQEEKIDKITKLINYVSLLIKDFGGTYEDFNPLDYMSGLESPDETGVINRIIQTTQKCYKYGTVQLSGISQDFKTISIRLIGEKNGNRYIVDGKITSNSWGGNEAIDYISTVNAGKLSVKCFENGRWIDRSSNYKIVYDVKNNIKEDVFKNISSTPTKLEKIGNSLVIIEDEGLDELEDNTSTECSPTECVVPPTECSEVETTEDSLEISGDEFDVEID